MCRFSTICFTKFGTNFSQLSGSQTSPVPCKMQACWFGYVRKINLKRKKSQGSEIKRSRARLYPRVHLCMPQNRGRRIKREKKKNLDKQMCSRKTLMIKWNPQKKTKFRRINGKTKLWRKTNVLQVVPHQFLGRLLPTVKAAMRNDAISVSLIKGMAAGDGSFGLWRKTLFSSACRRVLDLLEYLH